MIKSNLSDETIKAIVNDARPSSIACIEYGIKRAQFNHIRKNGANGIEPVLDMRGNTKTGCGKIDQKMTANLNGNIRTMSYRQWSELLETFNVMISPWTLLDRHKRTNDPQYTIYARRGETLDIYLKRLGADRPKLIQNKKTTKNVTQLFDQFLYKPLVISTVRPKPRNNRV